MEIFIGAISFSSLVLNYLIYRRITATYMVATVEETLNTQQSVESERIAEVPVPEIVKDIFMSRALPNVPKPTSGPLERPGGFV
jgi:hypothetical protein